MSTKALRCQCRNITNNKVCAHKSKNSYIIDNKRYCFQHYRYYMTYYTLIIQKHYRGHKQRNILNNIYKKLPDDIQYKIVKFIRSDIYYKKYINTLGKILEKKLNNFINIKLRHEYSINYIFENMNLIEKYFYLYNKYYTLINVSINCNMMVTSRIIKNIIHEHTHLLNDVNFVNKSLNLFY